MIKKIFHSLSTNSLARSSAIVFAGSMVANIGSYVYHLLMGRLLGPSGYGELSSLLSILYIFTVPLLVGQTVLVKFISGFKAHGDVGQAKSLIFTVTKYSVIACGIGLPLVIGMSPLITSFLHLPSSLLFILVYILFFVSLVTIILTSALQGYQKFVWFSILTSLVILVKLAVTVPLVRYGNMGVLVAAILAAIIVYAMYFIPLKFILRAKVKSTKLTLRQMSGFAVPTLLSLLGITSIYTTDIILVRHYFPSHDAGLYASLAILGKIIFYASSSVALVLFPVLSERTAKGTDTNALVRSAIISVAAISTLITLTYFLFPEFIVSMLFGASYTQAGAMLGLFGVFIAFFSIANIVINASLAIGKTGIWVVPMTCAAAQIIAISVSHESVGSIIWINIITACLLSVGSIGYYYKRV